MPHPKIQNIHSIIANNTTLLEQQIFPLFLIPFSLSAHCCFAQSSFSQPASPDSRYSNFYFPYHPSVPASPTATAQSRFLPTSASLLLCSSLEKPTATPIFLAEQSTLPQQSSVTFDINFLFLLVPTTIAFTMAIGRGGYNTPAAPQKGRGGYNRQGRGGYNRTAIAQGRGGYNRQQPLQGRGGYN
jgi:hypothetical protein